jgi:hypothetical protein
MRDSWMPTKRNFTGDPDLSTNYVWILNDFPRCLPLMDYGPESSEYFLSPSSPLLLRLLASMPVPFTARAG